MSLLAIIDCIIVAWSCCALSIALWPQFLAVAQHRIPLPPIGKTVKTVSRMGSKGSRFTLGSWVCSLDFAFASATVRKRSHRSQPTAWRALWPQLLMSSAKMFIFGHFKRWRSLVRVASVALCVIPTCLIWCPKRSVRQAHYFYLVFRRWLPVSWQAQHFGDLYRHFAGQAQHFRCAECYFAWQARSSVHSAGCKVPSVECTLWSLKFKV